MPRPMPTEPRWLRAGVTSRVNAVDRQNKVLRGYTLAQEGPFKSAGRGEFDQDALREIVRLGNAKRGGLKSRFAHPTLSDDGIGKFLGRARDLRMDSARDERTGKAVAAVRGDLHFDPSAERTPSGDLAGYVMTLAETDPAAFSSSLVLEVEEEWRLDNKKRPLQDEDGNDLPPLWRPKALHASDIVDTGDAVDSLLSADALPDAAVRQGCELLDRVFHGQPWEAVEARCLAWLERYKEHRRLREHPGLEREGFRLEHDIDVLDTPIMERYRLRLEEMNLAVRRSKERAR